MPQPGYMKYSTYSEACHMKEDEEDKDTVGREENGEEIGEIYNIRGSPYTGDDTTITSTWRRSTGPYLTPLNLRRNSRMNSSHSGIGMHYIFI